MRMVRPGLRWVIFSVLAAAALSVPPLIWFGARALFGDTPAPAAWQLHWTWSTFLSCAACSYGLRRSLPARPGRFVVGLLVLASAVLSAVVAFVVAWGYGEAPAASLPFLPDAGNVPGPAPGGAVSGASRPNLLSMTL